MLRCGKVLAIGWRGAQTPCVSGGARIMWGRWLGPLPLLLVLLVVTCGWRPLAVKPTGRPLVFTPVALPAPARLAGLGPFRLERIWRMDADDSRFGGYSALVPLPGGRLLAVGDRANLLRFSPPGEPAAPAVIAPLVKGLAFDTTGVDSESAARDPATGRTWIGWETKNAISRHEPGRIDPRVVHPPAMAGWPDNRGAETLARLHDGRFLVLREGFGGRDDDAVFGGDRHEGLLFADDPVEGAVPLRFTFVGPPGFYPVDAAQIPDGRVLILMRRLVWPIPARFAGRLVLADPRAIRGGREWRGTVVARLSSTLPIDNFEGLAVEPRRGGALTVWLIADANSSVTQRTLLWRMALDPKRLPAMPR